MDDEDAKMKAAPSQSATKPGAVASSNNSISGEKKKSDDDEQHVVNENVPNKLSQLEQDVATKQRASRSSTVGGINPGAVSVSTPRNVGDKEQNIDNDAVPNRLTQAEQDIATKQRASRSTVGGINPGAVSVTSTRDLGDKEQNIDNDTVPNRLSQSEQDIATKNRASRSTAGGINPGAVSVTSTRDLGDKEQNIDNDTVPNRLTQSEQDIATKQSASSSSTEGIINPGAVFVDNTITSTPQPPGAVREGACSSRLAAKVRGIAPENWNDVTPVASSLQSREDQYRSKIRDAESTVNSSLLDREQQLQNKIRDAGPNTEERIQNKIQGEDSHVASSLQDREDKLEGKIRANSSTGKNQAATSTGALTRLSNFEDAITTKQGDNGSLNDMPSTIQLQQREDIANTKRGQVNALLELGPPNRLLASENMLDTKIRENPNVNVNSGMKPAPNNEAIEYGEYYDPTGANLTVAQPVEAIEEDMYRQAAIEYDPDAKPPIYKSRRFLMYMGIIISAVVIGAVGAAIGFALTSDEKEPPTLKYRETLGIRENIEFLLEDKKELDVTSSPFRKALDWIMFEDPMALAADSPKLTQRFVAAYFYYTTSQKKPWEFGCSPAENGEKDRCSYKFINVNDAVMTKGGTRWLSNTDECEWGGISCDDFLQIREFELSGSGLSGTFPKGLMMLPFLQAIKLPHNSLEGALPEYLAALKHLILIDLRNNTFSGTTPDSWIESRSLQAILVGRNNLTGTINPNFKKMKSLKQLDFSFNSIHGGIPEEIGQFSNLYRFKMDNNYLNGTIPSKVGRLSVMEELYIHGNALSGTIPPELGYMSRLHDFRAQTNKFTGTIPDNFWNLGKLYRLDLFDNNFNGTISNAISKLADLTYMNINDNQFSGSFPSGLGPRNEKLIKVEATGNNFNGTVPTEICMAREKGVLSYLGLDCSEQSGGGQPEIYCPIDCCTLCCDADGVICNNV